MTITLGEVLRLGFWVFVLFNVLAVVAMSLVWLERKLLGRMQGRLGPTRVGPFGLLQPVADALKLLLKEDIAPGRTASRRSSRASTCRWLCAAIPTCSSTAQWAPRAS